MIKTDKKKSFYDRNLNLMINKRHNYVTFVFFTVIKLYLNLSLYCLSLTVLAAMYVCISFHTVSESTPIPPHGNKKKRMFSEKEIAYRESYSVP